MKYIIRLDDACETQDRKKWDRIITILEKYEIKSIIGVIPNNEDDDLIYDLVDESFWDKVREWDHDGHVIALHGYNHKHISTDGGINPIHNRSEFAGVELKIQEQKIEKGYSILLKNKIKPKLFYAPSHTYDKNTLNAIKKHTDIRVISDTFTLTPYKKFGFVFLPQQVGSVSYIPFGLITFCYHPNTMNENSFTHLEYFLLKNHNKFVSFDDINLDRIRAYSFLDKIISNLYFIFRRIFR